MVPGIAGSLGVAGKEDLDVRLARCQAQFYLGACEAKKHPGVFL